MSEASSVRVAVLAVILETDARGATEVDAIIADAAAQQGVDARVVLVDATAQGRVDAPDATLVRARSASRGALLQRALEEVDEPYVALALPGCRWVPTHLAAAVERLAAGADLVTCDYLLTDAAGTPIDRTSPAAMDEAPGPFWNAGLVARRDTLADLTTEAYYPVELDLLRRVREQGRAAHVGEPGFLVRRSDFERTFERAYEDAGLVTFARRPRSDLRLSVVVDLGSRALEGVGAAALRALCRQQAPSGSFEVVLVERRPDEREARPTRPVDYPVSVRRLRLGPESRRAEAWNAGLELARGELVLFLTGEVTAAPDLVERHIDRHDRHERHAAEGEALAVHGASVPRRATTALEEHLLRARTRAGGGWNTGVSPDGNLSVRRSAAAALAGFDAELEGPIAQDFMERLGRQGVRARFEASARVHVPGRLSFRELRRRALDGAGVQVASSASSEVHGPGAERRALEGALEELGRIDVAALRRLDGAYAELAENVMGGIAELVPRLGRAWRGDGLPEAPEQGGFASTPRDPLPLSVIVPTRDRPRALENLLQRLRRQDLDPERFEVLVVDDGSRTPVAEALSQLELPFAWRVLRQSGGGPARARNTALRAARGDVILFFNDDAVPETDVLRRHLYRHALGDRPRAVLGTFSLLSEHRVDSLGEYVETTTSLFAQPAMKPGIVYHGRSLCTGNVSVPRAALERVGGFDESFPFAGGEDSELGVRLDREHSVRVLFDPLIRCGHDHRMELSSLLGRKRGVGWAAYRMQEKHGDLGCLPFDTWPPTPTECDRRALALITQSRACADARQIIEEALAEERAKHLGPVHLTSLTDLMTCLEEDEFLRGALLAAAGLRPSDEVPVRFGVPGLRQVS